MSLTQCIAVPRNTDDGGSVPATTTDCLLDAALPWLLAKYDVVVTAHGVDQMFVDSAAVRSDCSLLFTHPASRPAAEWEPMARAMLERSDQPTPERYSDR